MISSLVNHIWWMAAWASGRQMRRAFGNPEDTQSRLLRKIIDDNADTEFGRVHEFSKIGSPADFAKRVPIRRYDEFKPWIDRIAAGVPGVLTAAPVLRLLPSSGSTAASKLIPFTASLGRQFNAAIRPWVGDLFRSKPDLARGCAYWSITPLAKQQQRGAVPIGFDEDLAYLGGIWGRLMRSVMAVPPEIVRVDCISVFQYATMLSLLRRDDLRLISIWHPSFLTLLLDLLPLHWDRLIDDVESGEFSGDDIDPKIRSYLCARPDRARANRLRSCGPKAPRDIWPSLGLVSCWADAGARGPARQLQERLGHVWIQPKGLLATEGVVSFPLGNQHPLAIRSHYMEFLDDSGEVVPAHQVKAGEFYEVLITTGGGLYRYRLGDRIRVEGMVARTHSVRFVGRADGVCDMVGEKLSEAFIASVLEQWCDRFRLTPSFAMLAPASDGTNPGYVLYIDNDSKSDDASAVVLDQMLRANPHYDWARQLGQLAPVRLFSVTQSGFDQYSAAHLSRGMRLGDIKPMLLSTRNDWSDVFADKQTPPNR